MVTFGWLLAASYAGLSASAVSIWVFVAALAPWLVCVGVLDVLVTAQLTKVGCAWMPSDA